ncbi:GNAT family N-acetyltransferase [Pseudophaeobacter sp. EL27]|uniref:GNAT family N-acetyltransferase n=1 Tax=Pseudophaeobacter sp. EL27 TaxID=2107580 RepID=UPI0020B1338E|nr:GNAT family N-acetyltransferase [Pseudophaeobacter sp. EL27]
MSSPPTPQEMARIHAAAFLQSRPWSTEEFTSLLESPLSYACGDRRCFALVRVIADEAELLTIATDPEFQCQGLARRLMQDWQTLGQSRGAKTCFLEVAEDNCAAIALYLAEGFATCGRRSGYYARRNAAAVDAIVMQKELP